MSKFLNFTSKLALSSFASILMFSCSKDADLLSEYVINDNDDLQSLTILTNDRFYMAVDQNTILMDVLNNDNLSANSNVTIIETSTPLNGIVTINDDNTLTYRTGNTTPEETTPEETTPEETTPEETTPEETTPEETTPEETTPEETTPEEATPEESTSSEDANRQEEETPTEDTFTYTAEVVDEETGTVTQEEATVTISTEPESSESSLGNNDNFNMGELFAFPGAEGFGKNTIGGRGGKIIHVTNLNDDGSGSLREAIETAGPRTIVFDVGGDIHLDSPLYIGSSQPEKNKTEEYITIAGETAPYPGITIRRAGIEVHCKEVIIRYISVRVNDNSNIDTDYDCIRLKNWDELGYDMNNVIIDHVSISNGDDENFSCQGVTNFTFQNSMITNANNSYTFLFGRNNFNFSFLGNYMSHTGERNVLVGYGSNRESSEYINNITYGYEEGMHMVWGNRVDVIGNIYKSFVDNLPRNLAIAWKPNEINSPGSKITDGAFHLANNYQLNPHSYPMHNADAIEYNSPNRILTNSLINDWETSITGIENRIFSGVGNNLFRDSTDEEAIADYFNNTGSFNSLSIPVKPSSSHPSTYDTDNDGMADDWEKSYFGDLSKNPNDDHNGDGYTNIEVFFASLRK